MTGKEDEMQGIEPVVNVAVPPGGGRAGGFGPSEAIGRASDTLDGVLIDADEDGFHLILSGMEREYDFRLPQDVALELMRAVRREIGPWAAEGGLG